MGRRRFLNRQVGSLVGIAVATLAGSHLEPAAASFAIGDSNGKAKFGSTMTLSTMVSEFTKEASNVNENAQSAQRCVAYKTLSLHIKEFNADVPIAAWFPLDKSNGDANSDRRGRSEINSFNDGGNSQQSPTYRHRISIRRIGQLLAGWDFIPGFMSKSFNLRPTLPGLVVEGSNSPLPKSGKVVLLAHGYLGSRFDLSHLAEALSRKGFIVISPEFPESLASSYDRVDGLNRDVITEQLLDELSSTWGVEATSFGCVGHSLGCGTAVTVGDSSWARVCIAGFPRTRDGKSLPFDNLQITSINDGVVSLSRRGGKDIIPSDYTLIDEAQLRNLKKIPAKAALVFERSDAPNHISYLTEGVNTAMIDLLSPLLPVAQAMNIPVLDFDKYQVSRDSDQTAAITIPFIVQYLEQQMS